MAKNVRRDPVPAMPFETRCGPGLDPHVTLNEALRRHINQPVALLV